MHPLLVTTIIIFTLLTFALIGMNLVSWGRTWGWSEAMASEELTPTPRLRGGLVCVRSRLSERIGSRVGGCGDVEAESSSGGLVAAVCFDVAGHIGVRARFRVGVDLRGRVCVPLLD